MRARISKRYLVLANIVYGAVEVEVEDVRCQMSDVVRREDTRCCFRFVPIKKGCHEKIYFAILAKHKEDYFLRKEIL